MAIIRTGSIVGAISGNLGGICFVAGKGAPIARQRIRKKDSQTPKQITQRALTQHLTRAWRTFSDVQQLAWRLAALKFPRTNRLGITNLRTALQLYLACAVPQFLYDGSTLVDPPPRPLSPPHPVLTFTASAAGAIRIAFPLPIWPFYIASIFASRPMSTTIPRHAPNLKQMFVADGNPNSFVDFTTEFDTAFGHPTQTEAILATCSIFHPGSPPPDFRTVTTIVAA